MMELKGKYCKDCIIYVDNIEEEAYSQIQEVLDSVASKDCKVRIMPDVHAGSGIVVGFTMNLPELYIDPDWIGCDIACQVTSVKLNTKRFNNELNLPAIDNAIKSIIPMGPEIHRGKSLLNEKEFYKEVNKRLRSFHSKFYSMSDDNIKFHLSHIDEKYMKDMFKRIHIEPAVFYNSIGTLGGGNHFIEIGIDDNNDYWLTVHCGSRNFGLKIWKYYKMISNNPKLINNPQYKSKYTNIKSSYVGKMIEYEMNKLNEEFSTTVRGLLFGEARFNYFVDMIIAEVYAEFNHKVIIDSIIKYLKTPIVDEVKSIHNYIDFNDFIIRKGAIRSYTDERCVIPFNMRDGLIICNGNSDESWNNSFMHGLGRCLSRGKAKESISLDEFEKSMKGIVSSSINSSTIDESPMAYKKMDEVLSNVPKIDIIHRIKPVLNIKASE